MSKKNKLSTRKNSHSHILERKACVLCAFGHVAVNRLVGLPGLGARPATCFAAGERADQLKRTAKAHKTNKKVTKAKKEGKTVKNKFKGIRIKKGVRIKVWYSI